MQSKLKKKLADTIAKIVETIVVSLIGRSNKLLEIVLLRLGSNSKLKYLLKNNDKLVDSYLGVWFGDRLYMLSTKFYSRLNSILRSSSTKTSFSQSGEDLIIRFIFNVLKNYTPSYIDTGINSIFVKKSIWQNQNK